MKRMQVIRTSTLYYGVRCQVRITVVDGHLTAMAARLTPTEHNPRRKWHAVDVGEMLARTDLELVR